MKLIAKLLTLGAGACACLLSPLLLAQGTQPCPGYPGALNQSGSPTCYSTQMSDAQCSALNGNRAIVSGSSACVFYPQQRSSGSANPAISMPTAPATNQGGSSRANAINQISNSIGGLISIFEQREAREREEREQTARLNNHAAGMHHFEEGRRLYRAGDFASAIDQWRLAQGFWPNEPAIPSNIALATSRLEEKAESARKQREEAAREQRRFAAMEAERAAKIQQEADERRRVANAQARIGSGANSLADALRRGANSNLAAPAAKPQQLCVRQKVDLLAELLQNARTCLINSSLIASYDDEPFIDYSKDPDLWVRIRGQSDRWRIQGQRAEPVCSVPLQVDGQNAAFLECARVNLCAAQSVSCIVQTAERSDAQGCERAADHCAAQYPVPTNVGSRAAGIR